ncbi:MAG TPA: hypothetical protein VFM18_11820 [Methanosarcina sp.]|nr:hypothetical protein [Methanosarcina sp.]
MAQFKYIETKTMSPRDTNRYSTTYIKQSLTEQKRLQQFVEDIYLQIKNLARDYPEIDVLNEPISKKHKRRDGSYYTIIDVINDLREQMKSGKDVPEAMVSRWNVAFKDQPDIQIDFAKEQDIQSENVKTFNNLFFMS